MCSDARQVTIVDVLDQDEGRRVDNWLQSQRQSVPKNLIQKVIRTGQLRVNGKRVKSAVRLKAGDRVRIPPMSYQISSTVRVPEHRVLALEACILEETAHWLALNKPSGWAVHAGSGVAYGVIEALRQMRPDSPQLELVHRLDRETTGCLLVAKTADALRILRRSWSQQVEKRYQAVLHGPWMYGEHRTVEAPLLKIKKDFEHHVVVDERGQHAISHFRCLDHSANWAWVEVVLETGRTHQIRAHAKHLGCPIIGDQRYATDMKGVRFFEGNGLFLHASTLMLEPMDGLTEHSHVLKAPWPEEKALCLSRCGLTVV